MNKREELCGGRFVGHAHLFAVLTNALVDPKWGYRKVGGENLSDVLYQRVDNEYNDLYKGISNYHVSRKSNTYSLEKTICGRGSKQSQPIRTSHLRTTQKQKKQQYL